MDISGRNWIAIQGSEQVIEWVQQSKWIIKLFNFKTRIKCKFQHFQSRMMINTCASYCHFFQNPYLHGVKPTKNIDNWCLSKKAKHIFEDMKELHIQLVLHPFVFNFLYTKRWKKHGIITLLNIVGKARNSKVSLHAHFQYNGKWMEIQLLKILPSTNTTEKVRNPCFGSD